MAVRGIAGSAVQSYTWATLPSAAANLGTFVSLSDYGGSIWYSNGTYWKPTNGEATLIQRSRPDIDSITGVVVQTEFTSAKVTVPAGMMQAQGGLLIDTVFTNSVANSNTPLITFGGSNAYAPTGAANRYWRPLTRINNNNATNAQSVSNSGVTASTVGSSTGAIFNSTVDTSVAFDIQFYITPTVGTDVLKLEWLQVKIILP